MNWIDYPGLPHYMHFICYLLTGRISPVRVLCIILSMYVCFWSAVSFHHNWNISKARVGFHPGRDFSPVFLTGCSFSAFTVGWLQIELYACTVWVRFHRGQGFFTSFLIEWFPQCIRCWMTTDGFQYTCKALGEVSRGQSFLPVICWNDSSSAFAVGWWQMEFIRLQSVGEASLYVSFLTSYLLH